MNPGQTNEQPQQSNEYQQPPLVQTPPSQPLQQQYAAAAPQHKPVSIKTGVLIILAPFILMTVSIFLYALFNFITDASSSASSSMIAEPSLLERIINIILFLGGALSVMAIVPCLVIGIVLLARR